MCFDKAMFYAAKGHLGQRDKGGHAYILHVMRVAMRLRTTDEELMSMAVMHDLVEDGKVTFAELIEAGFSDRVIAGLRLLTHQAGDTYDEYIGKMRGCRDALLVKREDLRDNSDITRLKGLRQKDFERMEKYIRSFARVEEMIKELRNV